LTQVPSLTVEKSADKVKFSEVGEVIRYSYKITNTGNVILSGPFTIVDDKIGRIALPDAASETLVPQATFTVTAEYIVTKDDIDAGFIKNLVKVTGTFDDEDVPGEDEVTIGVNSTSYVVRYLEKETELELSPEKNGSGIIDTE